MHISTDNDYAGMMKDHERSKYFTVISYKNGGLSFIPHGFFCTWMDEPPNFGRFHIGRCSGIGTGSIAKYDSDAQKLAIGRYVAGGQRLRFVLNGQHETRSISTCMFGACESGMRHPMPSQYGDTEIGHDVWIGDEVMVLGGSIVAPGCVLGARALLPPNFRSEPYGVYVGVPAVLKKFRFSEAVRERLVELAWWDLPLVWIKENNAVFLNDMTADEGRSIALLDKLQESKAEFLRRAPNVPEATERVLGAVGKKVK